MDPITIILAILIVLLSVYYLFYRKMSYFRDNGIPHLPPLPIVGNLGPAVLQRTSMPELTQDIYNFNPDAKYVGLYSMMMPVIMIRDPELIKSIGVKHFDSFPNHYFAVDADQEVLFSKNLIALQDQTWRDMRNVLSPSFTASKIKTMFKLMSRCGFDFAEFLAEIPSDKQDMDMKDILTRYTNDVIASCAFGINVDSMRHPENDFFVYGTKSTKVTYLGSIKLLGQLMFPKLMKWLRIRMTDKKMEDFFMNLVSEIVESREKTGIVKPDMIQMMMDSRGKNQEKDNLTLEDMTSQAFIFFLAGFETASSLMCFAAHEIAVNPEVHERLQNEIDEVIRSTDGHVTYEAMNAMKYLDAVINETLRMYPIAFATDRMCEKSFELPPALPGLKPVTVNKGTNVWFPAYGLQRDPKYFEEPEKFLPDRFLDETRKIQNSGVYIPFGIGPRMCIGNRFALLEIKVLFFYLLARCDLKPCAKTGIPLKQSRSKAMSAEGGFWLKVQPRDNIEKLERVE